MLSWYVRLKVNTDRFWTKKGSSSKHHNKSDFKQSLRWIFMKDKIKAKINSVILFCVKKKQLVWKRIKVLHWAVKLMTLILVMCAKKVQLTVNPDGDVVNILNLHTNTWQWIYLNSKGPERGGLYLEHAVSD